MAGPQGDTSSRRQRRRATGARRGVQKVQVVKAKRKRRGPRVTKLLKEKTVAKLKYSDIVSVNAPAGGIAKHTFRCNSCHDPDETTIGHQPLLWDTYKTLYQNYRVLSSKIKASAIDPLVGDATPSLFGIFVDIDTALTFTTGPQVIEDMRNKGGWAIYGQQRGFSVNNLEQIARSSFNVSMLDANSRDTAHSQLVNPSGTELARYYQLWVSAMTAVDEPSAAYFLIEMEFVVEFTSPIHVTQS